MSCTEGSLSEILWYKDPHHLPLLHHTNANWYATYSWLAKAAKKTSGKNDKMDMCAAMDKAGRASSKNKIPRARLSLI